MCLNNMVKSKNNNIFAILFIFSIFSVKLDPSDKETEVNSMLHLKCIYKMRFSCYNKNKKR